MTPAREALIRHGLKRYRKGCKCDVCRAAAADRHRRVWRRRLDQRIAAQGGVCFTCFVCFDRFPTERGLHVHETAYCRG